MEPEHVIDSSELVNEIRKRPAIWNTRTSFYNDPEERARLWNEISTVMGVQCCHLKEHWNELCSMYVKELRKSHEQPSSWCCFDLMNDFLKDHVMLNLRDCEPSDACSSSAESNWRDYSKSPILPNPEHEIAPLEDYSDSEENLSVIFDGEDLDLDVNLLKSPNLPKTEPTTPQQSVSAQAEPSVIVESKMPTPQQSVSAQAEPSVIIESKMPTPQQSVSAQAEPSVIVESEMPRETQQRKRKAEESSSCSDVSVSSICSRERDFITKDTDGHLHFFVSLLPEIRKFTPLELCSFQQGVLKIYGDFLKQKLG